MLKVRASIPGSNIFFNVYSIFIFLYVIFSGELTGSNADYKYYIYVIK